MNKKPGRPLGSKRKKEDHGRVVDRGQDVDESGRNRAIESQHSAVKRGQGSLTSSSLQISRDDYPSDSPPSRERRGTLTHGQESHISQQRRPSYNPQESPLHHPSGTIHHRSPLESGSSQRIRSTPAFPSDLDLWPTSLVRSASSSVQADSPYDTTDRMHTLHGGRDTIQSYRSTSHSQDVRSHDPVHSHHLDAWNDSYRGYKRKYSPDSTSRTTAPSTSSQPPLPHPPLTGPPIRHHSFSHSSSSPQTSRIVSREHDVNRMMPDSRPRGMSIGKLIESDRQWSSGSVIVADGANTSANVVGASSSNGDGGGRVARKSDTSTLPPFGGKAHSPHSGGGAVGGENRRDMIGQQAQQQDYFGSNNSRPSRPDYVTSPFDPDHRRMYPIPSLDHPTPAFPFSTPTLSAPFSRDAAASAAGPTAPIRSSSPVLEDITSFSNISFFISLYLRYQHALVPIVHKPTFSADVALRRDRTDQEFRALLLSLVAYVICQVPKSKMADFGQDQLEQLQSSCHVASRLIQEQIRKQKTLVGSVKRSGPNLTTLAILIADYFFCQALGDVNRAATTLGEASRLAYVMRLNHGDKGESDEPYDRVHEELRKRIFWQLYNTDK